MGGAALNRFADLMRIPIIQAPMAGGGSRPELAAAVGEAGGFGFLAAGYKTAEQMQTEIAGTRRLTSEPFGVNVFVPRPSVADAEDVAAYLAGLEPEATRLGVDIGEARWEDDDWAGKLDALRTDPVPVVSFTFGCPTEREIAALQRVGSLVVVTVTTPREAALAAGAGADGLAVQGIEAGGHRGSFGDPVGTEDDHGLLALIGAVRASVDLPLIAAGGITGARGVAAVLAAGATAAALGTAFLRSPESGASPTHKAALVDPRFTTTDVTRAFSGRRARGLVNRFMTDHPDAPVAYPEINNATKALRRAAADTGDPETLHLWAGQGFRQARDVPAGELVEELSIELRSVLEELGETASTLG
ncbi:MAG TPA: nitronate monooxygenase [Acidimicrobiales bacterium]|nr:nitronate monooxygenase [Acidimicrobiales bacterium]